MARSSPPRWASRSPSRAPRSSSPPTTSSGSPRRPCGSSGAPQSSPDGESPTSWCARPVGPCLIITPWNFPLAVPARGIGPALAAGCTVVLRPSSLTPLSALALGRILVEAGLPAGRPQHRRVLRGRRHRSAARRRAHPQADLHRLRGGRPPPDRAERRAGAARLGRARRLRARSWSSPTPTWTPRSRAPSRRRCETAARPAPPPTASTSSGRSTTSSPRRLAARDRPRCASAPAPAPGVGCGPMISARQVERLAGLVDDAVARGARVVAPRRPGPRRRPLLRAGRPRRRPRTTRA